MKRCPTCHLTYTDVSLNFCRRDGTPLVSDSSSLQESQATLIKLPPRTTDDVPTALCRSSPVSGNVNTSSSLTAPLQRRRRMMKSKVIDSLAVLPLVNESADPQAEYLSDGITESIINSLSQLPKLRVVPRSTVFRYKGREIDPQIVGQELGVRAVLTGRMLQLKDLLIVKTELVDVASESQIWGEQYRHQMKDIFALQEEISREISEKLRLKLSGEEKRRLSKRYTENTEAYHLYLKGRYYTNKRTEEWIKKGVEHFQQAADLDPNYALAYAGLADAYAFLASSTGGLPPHDTYPKAKAAAMRALEIDDALAEAHTSLGFCHLMYDWDFPKAEREFKRAIKLNPAYANAHDGYGFYLKATGQYEEAIRESKRAQKLDPLSLFANVSLAWAYYFARQYERAVEQARKALDMDPRFDFAHWIIAMSYTQQGKTDEAVALLNQAVILTGGSLTHLAHLGYAHALAGHREEALQVLDDLKEMARQKYVSAYYFALIYLGLKDDEQMFHWLERAIEERSGFMAFINAEPLFDHLRSETRFANIAQQVRPV
ncbi:MAG: tetratricopeptide repeat protein [Pyrinomonadaceae bacterium]|nr:tetratricopeptide repeat protein [Pyrinomonadaceae bacterium]